MSDYKFVLSYALTPGTALGQLGTVNVNGIAPYLGFSSTGTIVQDSENLDFAFLGTSTPGLISPPAGSFNPNAGGDYLFTLDAYDSSGDLIGQSDINVDVSAVPDSSWSIGLLGIGVLSLCSFRRFFEFHKQIV